MNNSSICTSINQVSDFMNNITTADSSTNAGTWVIPKLTFNFDSLLESLLNRIHKPQETDSSLTISDVIEEANNILGISKLHLAEVFDTSRQNLYNLLKNGNQVPTQETEERAAQVKEALDIISSICPYKLGASTMTCLINGERLYDELTKSNINLDKVRIFAQAINKRISIQQQSNLSEGMVKNQEFIDTYNAI